MKADVVITGAGIAGVSAAYFLTRQGIRDVVLVDERDPLSLTSDKSSECYRNWWPGPDGAMIAFMNHSIDLMEALALETGNAFRMNRRGYLYLTADPGRVKSWRQEAEKAERQGAGSLRIQRGEPGETGYQLSPPEGFNDLPSGADLILDPGILRRCYPYLAEDLVAGLHVRRAGWLSAQQFGSLLLDRALASGVRLVRGIVQEVEVIGGCVRAVRLVDGELIPTACTINAAGPLLSEVGGQIGIDLPVRCELHQKAGLMDTHGVIGRDAPLLICADQQRLDWTDDESRMLAEDESSRFLLEELPSGAHTRPDGGPDSPVVLLLWEAKQESMQPVFPPPVDPFYPEIALRGLKRIVPGLRRYIERPSRPIVDGGYYVKTPENRPLIGPLPLKGAYVYGALSGYGIMAACAGGELIAKHITGGEIPPFAPAFSPERYSDPDYRKQLENWGEDYQL